MDIWFECKYCKECEPIKIYALSSNGFDLECSVCKTRYTFGVQAVEQPLALDWAKCSECLGIMGTHLDTCKNNPANPPNQ